MRNIVTLISALLISVSASALTLKAVVPTDGATGVNIEGKVVLTFDVDVAVGTGVITLDGKAVTPVFVSKYTTISFAGLDYESSHTLVIPSGAIKSKTGDSYAGTTLTFTTKKRPEISPKLFDFIVDPKASPIYGKVGNTIASAIEAAPNSSGVRFHVFIKNGTYTETVTIPSTKMNISFIGQSIDSVIIRDVSCPVLTISGSLLYFENMTVQNTVNPDYTLYSIAVYAEGSKNIFKNVRLLGNQDTQRTGGDRHYYLHCDIRGTIDFIYGSGDIFYDSCSIYLRPRNLMMKTATTWDTASVISAGSHDNTNKWGFVFNRCTIDGDSSNSNRYSLGRPWQNSPRAVYVNTTMRIKPFSYGWTSMGSTFPGLYAEFGSVDAQGKAIDLSKRHARYIFGKDTLTAPFNPVLDEATASTYTLANVVGGTDSWKPNLTAIAPPAPTIHADINKISWTATPYTMCYIIFKNGRIVDYTLTPEFSWSVAGDYTVKAVGEFGNQSQLSNNVSTSTAVVSPKAMEKIDVQYINGTIQIRGLQKTGQLDIYNLAGIRVGTFQLASDGNIPWNHPQACIGRIRSETITVFHLLPAKK